MKNIFLFICVVFILVSCREINLHTPYGENDGGIPGKVQVLSYTALAGGAEIIFKSPEDEDLMAVVAKYTLDPLAELI